MKELDDIDKKILQLLQKDGRMTVKEMTTHLNLSSTPIFERIKKLEKSGVIDHYTIEINQEKIGKYLHAFAHISLKEHSRDKVNKLEADLLAIPEVLECHHVTGGTDIIIKILVEDIRAYRDFIVDKLFGVTNIGKIETFLSLEVKKNTMYLK